jgi:sulfate transport system ATP-binding protein
VLPGVVEAGQAKVGSLKVPAPPGVGEGEPVRVLIRVYDLKLWRAEEGIATVERLWALGDRVKVRARLDGGGLTLDAQFPRRSSLLRGVQPGCRVAVEVTLARVYVSHGGSGAEPRELVPAE